jgi:hypothetical protein
VDRCANVNRAVLMAFCGLLIAVPIWAEPREDAFPDQQFQEAQPQITPPKYKPKSVVTASTRLSSYAITCEIRSTVAWSALCPKGPTRRSTWRSP